MRLIDCFVPVFETLSVLPSHLSSSDSVTVESVKNQFYQQFAVLDSEVYDTFSIEQKDAAKFAVVALIDEKISETDWGARHKWSMQPMQKELFSTLNAGEVFFDKLDDLAPQGDADTEIRIVYLYCLRMGFCGRYFTPGEKGFLDALMVQQLEVVQSQLKYTADNNVTDVALAGERNSNGISSWLNHDTAIWLAIGLVLVTYLFLRSDYFETVAALVATLA